MPITTDDMMPEEVQEAGNAFAQGISQAAHGQNYATMLYSFGKIVAMMARRTDAGSVDELVGVIGAVAMATIEQLGEEENDEADGD